MSNDPAFAALKSPPHSIEAEQSLLGGLMLDNRALEKVISVVSEGDFYRRDHRLLFRAIVAIINTVKHNHEQTADAVTVSEWLERHHELESVGGLANITRIVINTPSAANVMAYAEIVREHSILRQLIQVGAEIADSGFNTKGLDSWAILDSAEQKIFQIAEQNKRDQQGFVSIQPLLTRAISRLEILFKQKGAITGIATGFKDFDNMTSGLQKGELVIIAGRPSMGKTTLAMNIAEKVAISGRLPVAVFSMEMPGEQIVLRLLSTIGSIDHQRIRTGQLQEGDWPRIAQAVSMLSETQLFIDDTPALTPMEIRAKARRLKREQGGLGLIVVDYLQLMQSTGRADNRVAVISEISRSLKSLARELDLPVIALSQLNRNLENRPNKRPLMSDLRESGSIEQDADLIVFIYRDEVYHENSPDKGIAEIIIGKQRNGPVGTIKLTFSGACTQFKDHTAQQVYGSSPSPPFLSA